MDNDYWFGIDDECQNILVTTVEYLSEDDAFHAINSYLQLYESPYTYEILVTVIVSLGHTLAHTYAGEWPTVENINFSLVPKIIETMKPIDTDVEPELISIALRGATMVRESIVDARSYTHEQLIWTALLTLAYYKKICPTVNINQMLFNANLQLLNA